jgi:hypothetical protein
MLPVALICIEIVEGVRKYDGIMPPEIHVFCGTSL